METRRISKYDGQSIHIGGKTAFELGNYLGGGAAGVVYEAVDTESRGHYAIKILHPVGFKLVRSSTLSRYVVVLDGGDSKKKNNDLMCEEDVRWLVHPGTKQVIAAFIDNKTGVLREMTLSKCMEVWGTDLELLEKINTTINHKVPGVGLVVLPRVPAKYVQFLRQRQVICNEIENMTEIGGHENVLQLYQVLELVQDSKATLFLVLELASGGELFDRIRVDEGCDEATALAYFKQLLSGVAYCHKRGVCHRDLKPENLLLADFEQGAVLKIADFGLSALCVEQKTKGKMRRLSSVVGSPHYVAPEILEESDAGYDGAKADMWSLGVILYAMLAGNLPFGKDLLRCQRFTGFRTWKQHGTDDHPTGASSGTKGTFPGWFFPRHLSPAVVDLLVRLLDPNPTARITVGEARNHLWLKPHTLPVNEDEDEETLSLFEEYHEDDDDEDDDEEEEFEEGVFIMLDDEARGRSIERKPFTSPPLAPTPVQTRPAILKSYRLEELCKSPGSLNERRLHRSLSPIRRHSSEEENVQSKKKENGKNVPQFNDLVKRSTRFSTAVPAREVLERIRDIVEQNPYPLKCPYRNIAQKLSVDYNNYTLDVMRGNIKIFTVRIFLIKAGTYMVEFIRGQANIFEFKQFYDQIRQRLSEIVKNDYTLAMLQSKIM